MPTWNELDNYIDEMTPKQRNKPISVFDYRTGEFATDINLNLEGKPKFHIQLHVDDKTPGEKLLHKPLTLDAIREMATQEDRITVIVEIPLPKLIHGDIEAINDLVELYIIGTELRGNLFDMSFKAVGTRNKNDESFVWLEVNADVSEILNGQNDE